MVIDRMVDGSLEVVVMLALIGSLRCKAFTSPTASSKSCVSTDSMSSVTVMMSIGSLLWKTKEYWSGTLNIVEMGARENQ